VKDFSFEKVFNDGQFALKTNPEKAVQCLNLIEQNQHHLSALENAKTHHSNIFLKADVKNTAGLIAWDIRNHFFSVV